MEENQQPSKVVQDLLEQDALDAERCSACMACAQAQTTGVVVSGIAFLVFYVTSLIIQQRHTDDVILCLFTALGIGAFPLGVVSGWLAFEIFHRTTIPVRRMAILFAIFGDLTLFGWILVFLSQRGIE